VPALKDFLYKAFDTNSINVLAMKRLNTLIAENADIDLWVPLIFHTIVLNCLVNYVFYQDFIKKNTNCSDDAFSTVARMKIDRIRLMVAEVRKRYMPRSHQQYHTNTTTTPRSAVLTGTSLRLIASLPPAFSRMNMTVNEEGKVVLPIEAILASKTSGKKIWYWVLFAQLHYLHEHDVTCQENCQVDWIDPADDEVQARLTNGVWIAVHTPSPEF
jgi:hypothetical protein